MYFNNAGWLLSTVYPSLVWKKKTSEKTLYLTFDDGPIPGVTECVLEELKRVNARASFFCVGDNVEKNSEVFLKVIKEGHRVGNHTFNHLNGWKSDDQHYFDNVAKCDKIVKDLLGDKVPLTKKLFRPPYGLIKRSQISQLKKSYEIIMWDVLTGDFNQELSPEKCLKKALHYTRPGSIIIFHDSLKAEKNLRFVLPRFLDHFIAEGFSFKPL